MSADDTLLELVDSDLPSHNKCDDFQCNGPSIESVGSMTLMTAHRGLSSGRSV